MHLGGTLWSASLPPGPLTRHSLSRPNPIFKKHRTPRQADRGCGRIPGMAGRRVLSLVTLGAVALAVAGPVGCAGRGDSSGFRVLTWNVLRRNTDHADTVRVILESDADILCLQEVTPDLERTLRRELGSHYPFLYCGGEYAVLSRYDLVEGRQLQHPPDSPRGRDACWVRVRTPGGVLQVLSLHLTTPRVLSGSALERIRSYAETAVERAREIRHFCSQLEENTPAVVLGDFNSLEGEPGIAFLVGARGFKDSYRTVHPDVSVANATWRAHGDDRHALQGRIDYVFCSPELAPTKAQVIHDGASGHWPVLASLLWAHGR